MSVTIIKKDVKHINIKVKPNLEVVLTAPLETCDTHIASVLKKRASWIANRVDYYRSYQSQESKEYVSGESFRYLGRQYRLKVVEDHEEGVKLKGGYFYMYVKNSTDTKRKQTILERWYKARAEVYFTKILAQYRDIVKSEVRSVNIRRMRTRWGSCNPSKSFINLNLELIKKPRYCIEYVVFHELAHLRHPNHSRAFYNYLSVHMPDWKQRKNKLENVEGKR